MATEDAVFGISMVRDEADIIGETITRMLGEVDHVVIADNGSTDGTLEILREQESHRVTVLGDPEPAYYQSEKMSALAARAAALGAVWVVPFDADERWYAPGPSTTVADLLRSLPADCRVASARLFDHVATALDPADGSAMDRMPWRRWDCAPLRKVAARCELPVTIEQGNHGASYPWNTADDVLVVRHFPYRSGEQFVRKVRNGAAAYAATDLPEDQGAHWRQYGAILDAEGPEALIDGVFRRWFWVADPEADNGLVFDPAP